MPVSEFTAIHERFGSFVEAKNKAKAAALATQVDAMSKEDAKINEAKDRARQELRAKREEAKEAQRKLGIMPLEAWNRIYVQFDPFLAANNKARAGAVAAKADLLSKQDAKLEEAKDQDRLERRTKRDEERKAQARLGLMPLDGWLAIYDRFRPYMDSKSKAKAAAMAAEAEATSRQDAKIEEGKESQRLQRKEARVAQSEAWGGFHERFGNFRSSQAKAQAAAMALQADAFSKEDWKIEEAREKARNKLRKAREEAAAAAVRKEAARKKVSKVDENMACSPEDEGETEEKIKIIFVPNNAGGDPHAMSFKDKRAMFETKTRKNPVSRISLRS